MLEITPWAREVLARAHGAATRLNPDARLRLAEGPAGLAWSLTDAPAEGDVVLDVEGSEIFVAPDLVGLVDVEAPHDRLVLRAAGSEPYPRPD